MPGIGPALALTLKSAINDRERFQRSKNVSPWVELTPGRKRSGERDIVGAITKAGDCGLRTTLCQAATVMLNRWASNWLKAWALLLAVRGGRNRAISALAQSIGVVRCFKGTCRDLPFRPCARVAIHNYRGRRASPAASGAFASANR